MNENKYETENSAEFAAYLLQNKEDVIGKPLYYIVTDPSGKKVLKAYKSDNITDITFHPFSNYSCKVVDSMGIEMDFSLNRNTTNINK